MTAIATSPRTTKPAHRAQNPIWRIVRLHAVSPAVFFGIPWLILASAWAISMIVGLILINSGADPEGMEGFRHSWAVLAPQWYLIIVGVQAIGLTFPFALGFGATRRDFWLGTSTMFVLVSLEMAVAIATLVQVEIATGGWGIGAAMFNALWYGRGWLIDFYSTFCLQLLVLFVGAASTTIYMRWRTRGMLVLTAAVAVLVLALIAVLAYTNSWASLISWLGGLTIAGVFTLVLAAASLSCAAGYLVIRRATSR